MSKHRAEMTPELEASLRRGLEQSARGHVHDLGSFQLADTAELPAMRVAGVTATAGEIIAALSVLDPDTPVISYNGHIDEYVNITDLHYVPDQGPAAVLEVTENYDSRQW